MWLLPLLSPITRFAAGVYYRLYLSGEPVPREGPLLLVANHPNSLLDPALVAAAAHRPIRFLAKAPLLRHPLVGWIVRGAGSIPVYRRSDDPGLMARNEEMFREAHAALATGSALALFPEGLSHNEPALAPLKTGAARIALGAATLLGRAFPIVPAGLSFREKDIFRSEAAVVVGRALDWADLAHRGAADADAVRELTGRIDAALRDVTINLEQWEDAPLVLVAEAVHAVEQGIAPNAAGHVERLRDTAQMLAQLRHAGDPRWEPLATDVATHGRRLAQLRLQPADLHERTDLGTATRWALRRVPFVGLPAILIAVAGTIVFFVPYALTDLIAGRGDLGRDARSTHKFLIGALVNILWIVLVAAVAGSVAGPLAGLAALVSLPPLGFAALAIRERWHGARGDARRFLLLRSRRELVAALRLQQRDLASRLEEIRLTLRESGDR